MATYLNWKHIHQLTGGKSRSTIWRWERMGIFPKRRQLGPNSVAWLETEVDDWVINREAAR